MAAKTLKQMRDRILLEVKKSQFTEYEPYIDDALVSAIRFYGNSRLWFLEKVDSSLSVASAGTTASLPDDFSKVITLRINDNSVWKTQGNGFDHVTFDDLKRKFLDANATGRPRHWALFGSTLYFDMESDATYTIDLAYIKKDTTLPSADGDTSVWFNEGQDVIRLKAMEFFYRDRLHTFNLPTDAADKYSIRAEEFYNRLLSEHNERQITAGLLR